MFDGKLTLGSGSARLKVDAIRHQIGLPATEPPPPPAQAIPEGKRFARRRAMNHLLNELAFTQPVFAERLPLAIGIDNDIKALLGCDPDTLRDAMQYWCQSLLYLRAIAKGGPRYALDRSVKGEVTPEHMAAAEQALLTIKQKIDAKRATKE